MNILRFFPARQQILLEDIYSLMHDGVTLAQAIDTIVTIYKGVTQEVAENMSHALRTGHGLAFGMEEWYPVPIVEIIRAGEEGGVLETALLAAINSYKTRVTLWQAFSHSMIYPLLVIVVACIVLVIIRNSVLVDFASIKPVTEWPSIGQHVFLLANIVQYGGWLIVVLLLSLIFAVYYTLQNLTGELRYQLDRWPILSLYRSLTAARFMETLGLLINNGVVLKEAFTILNRSAPPYLAWHLILMEYYLSSGKENISDVLDTKLIHHDDMIRLRVMTTGKTFGDALMSLGKQALQRYAKRVEMTLRISGGMLLMVGAILAAMMVLGIYSVGSMVAN